MTTKFIHINYRAPQSKEEKSFFGRTQACSHTADIFFNIRKNKKSHDLVDTFFHEMAHVFFAFHGKSKQMTDAQEEKLAQQVGHVCAGVLK